MSGPKPARVLLAAAQRDMTALRGMADSDVFANGLFGFHVQQAAEKLLKASLSLPGKPCPAIHGLTRLLELLEAHRPEAEGHSSELIASNPCAAQLRDSAGDPGLSPPDRNAAYSFWKNFRRGAERTWRKIDLRQVLAANMPSRLHRPARPPSDRLRLA